MLKIERRAHARKGTPQRKGSFVKRTVYLAKDQGKKGRGPTLIKIKKPGSLGGPGFFSKPAEERRQTEAKLATKMGEKKVQGKLQAVATFGKKTSPETAEKAAQDRQWVASNFKGKVRVKPGEGLS